MPRLLECVCGWVSEWGSHACLHQGVRTPPLANHTHEGSPVCLDRFRGVPRFLFWAPFRRGWKEKVSVSVTRVGGVTVVFVFFFASSVMADVKSVLSGLPPIDVAANKSRCIIF